MLGCLWLLAVAGFVGLPAWAGNIYTPVPSGSDIAMEEMRWPYANGHVFNPWTESSVNGSDGPSLPFYFGNVMPDGSQSVQFNFSLWPISNPLNPNDVPVFIYTDPSLYSPVGDTGESTAGHAGGTINIQTNQWYRYVLCIWQPADGTPHLGYVGGWLRWQDGTWHHMGTVQVPFAASGLSGIGGFQENAGGSTTPWRTDYRNCYYHYGGSWQNDNQMTFGQNGGWLENSGVISNGTVAFLECCPSNNTVGYVGTPFNNDIPVTITNQPATPTFDPIVVSNATASYYGNQLLVQWQEPTTSSPQLGYKIEVFNNSGYTGSPSVTFFGRDPEVRQSFVNITGVSTPYVRLTISDIFANTNTPVLITPSTATLSSATNVTGAVNGLAYTYYQSTSNYLVMPNFSTLTPVLQGAVNNPDLTPRLTRTQYAFNYNGFINVTSNGLYGFTLQSYDGSKLYVDGTLVVNNDGDHSTGSKVGAIGLAAGKHVINVQYFMDTAYYDYCDTLTLSYSGPGITNTVIPDSAFYRVPAAGEPTISLTAPVNGSTVCGSNVTLAAGIVTNGVNVTGVQFYNGNSYLGQSLQGAALNLLMGNSPSNSVRARVLYNNGYTLDSSSTAVATTNMNLGLWSFTPMGFQVYPAGVNVAGSSFQIVGDNMNLLARQVTGDCTLIGRLTGLNNSGAPDGSGAPAVESGIILRGNTNTDIGDPLGGGSGLRFAAVFGKTGGTYYQDDTMMNGGGAYSSGNLGVTNHWFKITRVGDTFTSYVSADGASWTAVNTNTLTGIGSTIYGGMFTYTLPTLDPIVPWASLDNFSLMGNVVGAPLLTVSPQIVTNYVGQSVAFSATVTVGDPPFTYQWQQNGVNIAGATNTTLTLTNLQPFASGIYTVVLNTANGALTNAGNLYVLPAPGGSTVYSGLMMSNTPFAYWRMNEVSGTTMVDSSGNSRNGTYANVTLAQAGPQPAVFPGFEATNLAVAFNGSTSQGNIGTTGSLNGTTDFSVMAWVKTTSGGVIIQQRDSSGSGYVGQYQLSINGTVNFYVYNSTFQFNLNSSQSVNDGQWHQIVGVRSGANGYIYVDGVLSASGSGTVQALSSSIGTYIGYNQRDGNQYFNGTIDEVAVFNKALSSAGIQNLYQAAVVPPSPLLTLTAPADGTVFGASVPITLSATTNAGGHAISYVQFYNGSNLLGQVSSAPYSLVWSNAAVGTYSIYAQMSYDSTNLTTSAPAIIKVIPPVTINSQPQSQTNLAGVNVSFSVGATGVPPFAYQWLFNNSTISGATNATLTITNSQVANSGNYYVVITPTAFLNAAVTSAVAKLSVYLPPSWPATVLSNGPVAYWRMNETNGTTAYDSSSNGLNSTYVNCVLGTAGPQPTAYPGFDPNNLAVQLDGASSHLNCPAGASLNGTTDFSVMAWVKTTSGGAIIQQRDSSGSGYAGEYQLSINGTVNFYVYNSTYQFNLTSSQSVTNGQWHQIVGVRSGTSGYIYIDGVLSASGSGTVQALSSSIGTYIGYNQRDGNQYFNGTIDEVAIFNKALSFGTISNLYRLATNAVPVTYSLNYSASPNGTISGTSPQTVNSGASGAAVTPVPGTGYHFVNWSDGSTANPRTDSNVTNNISVTASFAINSYTLTYAAGANGSVSGTSPQTVNYGASGSSVTAVANTGYYFVNWSDSSTANPRTDGNVTNNLTVTANFSNNPPAPWMTNKLGVVTAAPNTTYSNGTFTVTGAGAGLVQRSDSFWYVSQPTMTNQETIIARITSQATNGSAPLAGVMIRQSTNANSAFAFIGLSGSAGAKWIDRTAANNNVSSTTFAGYTAPYWVCVSRATNTFTSFLSADGVTWTQKANVTFTGMTTNALIGLAVASGSSNVLNTAVFDSVSVTTQSFTQGNPPVAILPAQLSNFAVGDGNVTFTVSGGGLWMVESSTDLVNWVPLNEEINLIFGDPADHAQANAGGNACFYRLIPAQ